MYATIFVVLTALHICSHLNPIIKANASIKTINLEYTRELELRVGYEYNFRLLWQAVVNTLIVVYGLWRCEREVDRLLREPATRNELNCGTSYISPATEVKLNWLRSKGELSSSWKLFPLRVFAMFTVPWLVTFLMNGFFGFSTVNLVMQHFCASHLEVLMLYFRIQLLYLESWLPHGITHYAGQLNGALEFLFATHTNFISYQTDVLAGVE